MFIHLAAESMLAAVRFIGNDDDVSPPTQLGHHLALFRHEFVNRREHHAATRPDQQLAQMLAPAGLHRRLAEDVRAALELAEKLVIEIVAIGQHNQRRVLHRRMPHHARGEDGSERRGHW